MPARAELVTTSSELSCALSQVVSELSDGSIS